MYIEFEKIKFRNFLSYGNSVSEIILNANKFSLITGVNGTGKSSLIVDSISWCLFGKLHREGITQKQIINNVNKKECEVALDFTIDQNKYTIKRGLKPNYLELHKNDKPQDQLSSTVLVQKEINRLIQMDVLTFKNISILSVNTSKPFIDLTPQETRNITEVFLGLKMFSLMLDIVKKRIKDTKDILKGTEKDYGFVRELVRDGKEKLTKYKELKAKFESEKNLKISGLEDELHELEKHLKAIEVIKDEGEVDKLDEAIEIKDKERDTLMTKATKFDFETDTLKRDIKGYDKEKKFFEDNTICPTCESEMNDNHRHKHIKTFDVKISAAKKKIVEISANSITDNKKIDKISATIVDLKKESNSLRNSIITSQSEKVTVERDIKRTKIDIDKVSTDTIDNHISGLIDKEKIKEYVGKYKKLKAEKGILELKQKQLNALKTVLSDDGVKASAIKKDLPFLNSSIQKYMKTFNKDFTVVFSDTFEVELKGFSKKGLSYHACSSGEKKRIDLSILLSFIDMTRNKNSIHTNILVLDEICDSSLDAEALEIFIEILQNKTLEGQLKNIFIVSHNPNMSIEDCERITCYKEDNFSKIKIEG